MKCIFLLSGDYVDIAEEEVISLFGIKDCRIIGRLLIADLNINESSYGKIIKRLALTKNIYRLLFECRLKELDKKMQSYEWKSVYKGNFCLRIKKNDSGTKSKINLNFFEKDLAGYVWSAVKNPKVNLKNPKTKIELFFAEGMAYCGLLIHESKENFESRKPHLRPFPHPSSLHPKLARALVNVTGVKENDLLIDPFCGTGGFLIEAALMKIKIAGCDINRIMVDGCKENLKNFKIKNFKVFNANALKILHKSDYVLTDLPYGINSNACLSNENNSWKSNRINLKIQKKDFVENLEQFYLKFLKQLRKSLKNKAVIIFPSFADYKVLLKKSKFKIEKEFSIYIHRSLTRKIVRIS